MLKHEVFTFMSLAWCYRLIPLFAWRVLVVRGRAPTGNGRLNSNDFCSLISSPSMWRAFSQTYNTLTYTNPGHEKQFTIRREFLHDVGAIRVRLFLVGLAHVVLLPFLLLFMLVYFFLQNAQEWHSSKVRGV